MEYLLENSKSRQKGERERERKNEERVGSQINELWRMRTNKAIKSSLTTTPFLTSSSIHSYVLIFSSTSVLPMMPAIPNQTIEKASLLLVV